MDNRSSSENRPRAGRVLPIVFAAALAATFAAALGVVFTVSLPRIAQAHAVTPPRVPADIEVPAANQAFLQAHAVGTQNYICLPYGSGVAWTFFAPQAALFEDHADKQVTTHFFSPDPLQEGKIRATWQHSRDSSTIWGQALSPSYDPDFVAPNAIPWLLIQVVRAQEGPAGGDTLASTTYIQRLNTHGGGVPASGCTQMTDVGRQVFVPYTADYFFYTDRKDR